MKHRTRVLRLTDHTSAALCSCGWTGGKNQNHDIGITRLQANDHVFNNWPAKNEGVQHAPIPPARPKK